ncbi:MAG: hypothetical protein JKY65_34035 [Planctomycetes bacterium]|nr:hypothetical protein [Planctomycetota bacterium]
MRWTLVWAILIAGGCASSTVVYRDERVYCEHEGYHSDPHALFVPSPSELDLDLMGGLDPVESARVEAYVAAVESGRERQAGLLRQVARSLPACQRAYYEHEPGPRWDQETFVRQQRTIERAYRAALLHYEQALLVDLRSGRAAFWVRLRDLFRLAARHAHEIVWRRIASAGDEGGPLTPSWTASEEVSGLLNRLVRRLDSGVLDEETTQKLLADNGFKTLLRGVRRAWALGPRDPASLVKALKRWRRSEQVRPRDELRGLAEGAEGYRNRALDAALDATLSAERAREAAPREAR